MRAWIVVALVAVFTLNLFGAPMPKGGRAVLLNEDLFNGKPGGGAASNTEFSEQRVKGPSFTKALRVKTLKPSQQVFFSQLLINIPDAIREEDTLFLRVWMRTVETTYETGKGTLTIGFPSERPDGKWLCRRKVVNFGKEWMCYDMPIILQYGAGKGEATLAFYFGGTGTGTQTIELGGLELINLGPGVRPETLPLYRETYEGREPDAPWRKDAAARIEQFRKADLTVVVKDPSGQAVPGAKVEIEMLKQAYAFGNGGWEKFYDPAEQGPDSEMYRKTVLELFNYSILGRGFLWGSWERADQRKHTDAAIDWLHENGFTVHGGGHLVWPSFKHMSDSVSKRYKELLKDDGEKAANEWLRTTVREHVRDLVRSNKGRVEAWNVINESHGNREFMDLLGREEMLEWFRIAHEEDPAAKLYINEHSVLSGEKLDYYISEIRYLLDHGAPLHGIGVQGHLDVVDMNTIKDSLDQLAQFNLPILMTEFDMVTADEPLRADYMRDLFTLFYSHPATSGIVMWGHWDGMHWLNCAPLYYEDWTLKPSGEVFRKLVREAWRTNGSAKTNSRGELSGRAFFGTYRIRVSAGSKHAERVVDLSTDGQVLEVVL